MTSRVALDFISPRYPESPPFDPNERFPEYPLDWDLSWQEEINEVYAGVRRVLYQLGLDAGRFGTAAWNPLGDLVGGGQTVLLKPNLVVSEHEAGMRGLIATIANPSVLRALCDMAFKAVGPKGLILIGDSPIKEVDFERV